MDVRFYPAAAGSSLPGDPSNLDFAQCLGYYNYNKVIIPAWVNSSYPFHTVFFLVLCLSNLWGLL
uniref:Uncharacterized protein n=1 Tax=Accipiter nisus TaxID=211598 RepID=A0A8B9MHK4_9AVES